MRFNQVALAGRLTADPELKVSSGSGTAICELRIAFDQGTKDNKKTGYANVTAFGPTAERAKEYLKKGSALLVGGRLDFQEWQTDSGQKRSTIKIVAHDIQFLDGNKKQDDAPKPGGDGW